MYLEQWKNTLPDMPEINFDINARNVFEEIKNLQPIVFRKLFNNKDIIEQIFPIIFPEGKVLKLLHDYFMEKNEPIYKTLSSIIPQRALYANLRRCDMS